ncbi:hypothetical protein MHBO_003042, partial [Bonamia ostreae]
TILKDEQILSDNFIFEDFDIRKEIEEIEDRWKELLKSDSEKILSFSLKFWREKENLNIFVDTQIIEYNFRLDKIPIPIKSEIINFDDEKTNRHLIIFCHGYQGDA